MIEELIAKSKGKYVLFIGKLINLTPKEIDGFLEKKGIKFVNEYEEGKEYAFIVLSSMINPYEEELSYQLYDMGIKDIKLEVFEGYYTKSINPKSLLMSIKLKKDSNRVKRLLKLKNIDQELYLELLNLYTWEDGGVFDTDSNRDTTITFIKKFLPKKENVNHNDIVHSPASLLDIALTSTNTKALEAMLEFPKYELKSRGKEPWKPIELKEFIAINPYITNKIIDKLLKMNNQRVDTLLALNSALDERFQDTILQRATLQGKINLTKNINLSDNIFKKLLISDVKKELLNNQKITKERVALIDNSDLIYLTNNTQIEDVTTQILFIDKELDHNLSKNSSLKSSQIENLYKKYENEIAINISQNINTPQYILEKLYKLDDWEIMLNLASNPSTPMAILDKLCEQDNRELNLKLATNHSIGDDYLEYFKVDNELLRAMSENKKFLKKMENKPII